MLAIRVTHNTPLTLLYILLVNVTTLVALLPAQNMMLHMVLKLEVRDKVLAGRLYFECLGALVLGKACDNLNHSRS